MTRLLILMLAGLVLAASGCGGGSDGEDLVGEDSLRDCLADAGIGDPPPGTEEVAGFVPLGSAVPDFRAYSADGATLDVIVQGTEEKAERTAADVSGALRTAGAGEDLDARVLTRSNVIVVFDPAPSDATRRATEDCLES